MGKGVNEEDFLKRSNQSGWPDVLNRRKFQEIGSDFYFKYYLGQNSLMLKLMTPVAERPKTHM